jgi:hypothetical protein
MHKLCVTLNDGNFLSGLLRPRQTGFWANIKLNGNDWNIVFQKLWKDLYYLLLHIFAKIIKEKIAQS